jgi:hypothetical protein
LFLELKLPSATFSKKFSYVIYERTRNRKHHDYFHIIDFDENNFVNNFSFDWRNFVLMVFWGVSVNSLGILLKFNFSSRFS